MSFDPPPLSFDPPLFVSQQLLSIFCPCGVCVKNVHKSTQSVIIVVSKGVFGKKFSDRFVLETVLGAKSAAGAPKYRHFEQNVSQTPKYTVIAQNRWF